MRSGRAKIRACGDSANDLPRTDEWKTKRISDRVGGVGPAETGGVDGSNVKNEKPRRLVKMTKSSVDENGRGWIR